MHKGGEIFEQAFFHGLDEPIGDEQGQIPAAVAQSAAAEQFVVKRMDGDDLRLDANGRLLTMEGVDFGCESVLKIGKIAQEKLHMCCHDDLAVASMATMILRMEGGSALQRARAAPASSRGTTRL